MNERKCRENRRKQLFDFLPGQFARVHSQVLAHGHAVQPAEHHVCGIVVPEHIYRRIYVVKGSHFGEHLVKLHKFGQERLVLGHTVGIDLYHGRALFTGTKGVGHIFFYKNFAFGYLIKRDIARAFAVIGFQLSDNVSVVKRNSGCKIRRKVRRSNAVSAVRTYLCTLFERIHAAVAYIKTLHSLLLLSMRCGTHTEHISVLKYAYLQSRRI